jgi:hypothetical protein
MSYLDIARSVITGDETAPAAGPEPPGEAHVPRYEINERNEKSSGTDAEVGALGLDPTLRWIFVYRGLVEASTPPQGWGGVAPASCGVPHACCVLGPCPHFNEHGRCWKVEEPR